MLNFFGSPLEIANKIQSTIYKKLHIPTSIGLGSTKVASKMSCEFKKPMGISTLWDDEIEEKMWPLPVEDLFGVGSRIKKRMNMLSIYTIGDLAKADVKLLKQKFGIVGVRLWQFANNIDDSFVDPTSLDTVKSVGNQITLPNDYTREKVKTILMDIAEQVGTRARTGHYEGKTIHLSIRDTDLFSYGWSKSMSEDTSLTEVIYREAVLLLEQKWPENKLIRSIGLTLSNLIKNTNTQTTLFSTKDKLHNLNNCIDKIRLIHGNKAVFRGRSMI